jgi:catechol-2,3-dioxygenase
MDPHSLRPGRRQFLTWTSSFAAFLAAHGSINADKPSKEFSPLEGKRPRILSLELLCSAPLAKMRDFYHQLLGLRVMDEQADRLTLGAGGSRLTFVKAGPGEGKPFYHFAFNIPENKLLAARNWQKERTPLLPIPPRLRDPNYPGDVVNYSHWNAHSIFFFDPAQNVVEYIARHDLQNCAPGDFSTRDILYASEIGLIVDDVPAMSAHVREVIGVKQYRGGDEQFTALGDEYGLLLVMKRGRVISFDAPEKKAVSVFRTVAAVCGGKPKRHLFPGFPYEICVEA